MPRSNWPSKSRGPPGFSSTRPSASATANSGKSAARRRQDQPPAIVPSTNPAAVGWPLPSQYRARQVGQVTFDLIRRKLSLFLRPRSCSAGPFPPLHLQEIPPPSWEWAPLPSRSAPHRSAAWEVAQLPPIDSTARACCPSPVASRKIALTPQTRAGFEARLPRLTCAVMLFRLLPAGGRADLGLHQVVN